MPGRRRRPLTELELEIMQIVWKHGEVTVKDLFEALREAGRPLALPSIRTMLSILQDKGFVKRRPAGRGHAYRATVSAHEGRRRILKDIIERAFEGSASSLVTALVNGELVSEKEIEEVKHLIEQHERGAQK